MDKRTKLYLLFNDRLGIVADISTLVAGVQSSITAMEVEREHDKAEVYLELEDGRSEFSQEKLFELLGKVPGLIEMKFIETLPRNPGKTGSAWSWTTSAMGSFPSMPMKGSQRSTRSPGEFLIVRLRKSSANTSRNCNFLTTAFWNASRARNSATSKRTPPLPGVVFSTSPPAGPSATRPAALSVRSKSGKTCRR